MKEAPSLKSDLVFIVPAITYEGISKQVLLQIEALIQVGYQVKLIVLTSVDKSALTMFSPSLNKYNVFELKQKDSYLSVRGLMTSLSASQKINNILKNIHPEIVFAHTPYAHFLIRITRLASLKRNANVKVWQYFHSLQYQEYPLNSWRRTIINNINIWLSRRFDHGHIFVSKAVRNDVRNNLIDLRNNRVIYNALPLVNNLQTSSRIGRGVLEPVKDSRFTIVIPGRLEKVKGQLWFLEVFYQFIQKEKLESSKIELIILGSGSLFNEINEQVTLYKLQNIVKLTGAIDNAVSEVYIKHADLVIIPSLLEGFGLVLLEALMHSKTVLSSDAGGLKEILEHNKTGLLFKASDFKDCLSKLTFIYQNREKNLIDKMAVEEILNTKFSFKKHMQEIIAVIENG